MEIIKEINYDWMWGVGLVILIIGIILFIIFIIDKSAVCVIATPVFILGVFYLVGGIINGPRFRVKLNDAYTVHELIERCESVKYEPDYGTWLVRFKQEEDQNGKQD